FIRQHDLRSQEIWSALLAASKIDSVTRGADAFVQAFAARDDGRIPRLSLLLREIRTGCFLVEIAPAAAAARGSLPSLGLALTADGNRSRQDEQPGGEENRVCTHIPKAHLTSGCSTTWTAGVGSAGASWCFREDPDRGFGSRPSGRHRSRWLVLARLRRIGR